jgi:hypothetical protein
MLCHYVITSSIKDAATWLDRGPLLGLLPRAGTDDKCPANRDICRHFRVSYRASIDLELD